MEKAFLLSLLKIWKLWKGDEFSVLLHHCLWVGRLFNVMGQPSCLWFWPQGGIYDNCFRLSMADCWKNTVSCSDSIMNPSDCKSHGLPDGTVPFGGYGNLEMGQVLLHTLLNSWAAHIDPPQVATHCHQANGSLSPLPHSPMQSPNTPGMLFL